MPPIDAVAAAAVVIFSSAAIALLGPKGEERRGAAFVLAWLLPGAGHAILGKWKKGLFFFAILAATWLGGTAIVGFKSVSFDENPFYYVGQYGSGAMLALAKFLPKSSIPDGMHPNVYDPGLLYMCVAGLMNIVVLLNVFDVDLKKPGEAQAPAPAPAPAPPEKVA